MDSKHLSNRDDERIAWGLLFILWGITALFDFLPLGFGFVGTGVVLLGLNAFRKRRGVPTKGGTTILGILALVGGGLDLASDLLPLPFDLSFLAIGAILLILLGLMVLARVVFRIPNLDVGSSH